MEKIFIYILVAVIFFASNYYKRKKKQEASKNQTQPVPKQTTTAPSSFEEFLKKISGEIPDEPQPVPVSTPKSFQKKTPKPFLPQTSGISSYTPISKRENSQPIENSNIIEINNLEIEDEHTEFQINTPEDIQKGFIYSEILNRKYF